MEELKEIKHVLKSVWWTQKRLQADLDYLTYLRSIADGVRGIEYDRQIVHGGAEHNALEDSVELIIKYEDKIKADTERWTAALHRVMRIIDAVKDQRYQVLLIHRYRDLWTWERIAIDMKYSWQHIHRLHGRALKVANEIWQKQKEEIERDTPSVI